MKPIIQKTLGSLNLIFIILLTTACGQAPTSLPTRIITPTHSATPTLTLTPQPSNTPTASPTPIAIETLPVEQARARLLNLLATNGNCRLPCLWGITPGKSTYQEAQAILAPLSILTIPELIGFKPNRGYISPVYTEGDFRLSTDAGFLSDNQIVNSIGFRAEEIKVSPNRRSPIYDSKIFGERLRPYMLSRLLSELGRPASVDVQTAGIEITGSGGFEIVLTYPDQGVLVHYITQMKVVGAKVKGCMANAQVEMELYPSGDADSFVKSLSKTLVWSAFVQAEPMNNSSWKPIDKATPMSLEQFYETFRQPTDKCIETPAKQWPTPEIGGDPYQTAP